MAFRSNNPQYKNFYTKFGESLAEHYRDKGSDEFLEDLMIASYSMMRYLQQHMHTPRLVIKTVNIPNLHTAIRDCVDLMDNAPEVCVPLVAEAEALEKLSRSAYSILEKSGYFIGQHEIIDTRIKKPYRIL